MAETVDTAFNGHVVSQVLEEQRTYDVLVRFDDSARQSVETISNTLIDTPTGVKVPIAQVAQVRVDQGPNTINRENVQRRIIVQANVADRDLGSVIEDVRTAISQKVQLPQGYFVQYGGQFESQEKASRQILLLSIVAIAGIFLLLYIALKSVRSAFLVMANLPLALDRRRGDGFHLWRHAIDRVTRWFHHSVWYRHAQRHHADQSLLPLDDGRRRRLP